MKQAVANILSFISSKKFLPKAKVFAITILLAQNIFASTDSTINSPNIRKPDYFIDDYQDRIDLLDGTIDHRVDLGDSALTAFANRVYLRMIDSIQGLIENKKFDDSKRKGFRDALYLQMRRINPVNISNVKHWNTVFKFMLGELNAIKQKRLYNFLINNIAQSFNTLTLYKSESCADSFLILAAQYRPDLVFTNYGNYLSEPYAQHVLEEAAKIAPVMVKKYLIPGSDINDALKGSNDSVVQIILEIKNKYTRKSNAFTLLDEIVNGNLSLERADAIGSNPEKYLRMMLKIRAKRKPLAVHSLEAELEIYSLKFVRVLNDLHNEKDKIRFVSIEDFSPEEIYTLMVYSEEEIFTSSFNGLFKRLMVKLGPVSGFEFLNQVGDNRFRTFIKMCAGFGKLGEFLQSMATLHQQMLMVKFATGLEKYNDLSQAVEVADAFGSITDSLILKILRGTIKYEYLRLNTAKNYRGTAIYGLLSNLFVDRKISNANWFTSVAKQFSLPSFDKIANQKLFARDSVNRWFIYFYDDEDGDFSFSSFTKTFVDPNWKIIDSGIYIIIKSDSGLNVNIYANKPKNEYEGQERIEKIFADNDYEANVMVHRGHSYYAYKTIEKIKDNTQIFLLGSCGGYHSISSIIERSPEASIISSKQIGTMFVNNPMLRLVADNIRTGRDVEWQSLWTDLNEKVKDNPKALERFLDYIPPHKNLGAIFIKTYNKMMEGE